MDSAGEKSHRQLIDCIRSKDTDALVEAIDTGGMLKIAASFLNNPLNIFFSPHPTQSKMGKVSVVTGGICAILPFLVNNYIFRISCVRRWGLEYFENCLLEPDLIIQIHR
jgi:hypothetical protein